MKITKYYFKTWLSSRNKYQFTNLYTSYCHANILGKSFSPEAWVISTTHYYTWLSYFWGKHSLKVDDSANYKLVDRDIFYYLSIRRGIATYTMYSGSGLGRQNLVNQFLISNAWMLVSHESCNRAKMQKHNPWTTDTSTPVIAKGWKQASV